jgi:hypothetical protein
MPLTKRKELAAANSEMAMIDQRAPELNRPVSSASANIGSSSLSRRVQVSRSATAPSEVAV